MSDGERDAFGNPLRPSGPLTGRPAPGRPAAPERPPDLGGFAPPVAPPPSSPAAGSPRTAPPATSGGHTIATGHHTGTTGGEWTRSPQPTASAPGTDIALALGIGGLFFPPLAPFAWYQGRKAIRAVDASRGSLGGRGKAVAGLVLGMAVTVLFVVSVVIEGLALST